jgi:hypothetical protein
MTSRHDCQACHKGLRTPIHAAAWGKSPAIETAAGNAEPQLAIALRLQLLYLVGVVPVCRLALTANRAGVFNGRSGQDRSDLGYSAGAARAQAVARAQIPGNGPRGDGHHVQRRRRWSSFELNMYLRSLFSFRRDLAMRV